MSPKPSGNHDGSLDHGPTQRLDKLKLPAPPPFSVAVNEQQQNMVSCQRWGVSFPEPVSCQA